MTRTLSRRHLLRVGGGTLAMLGFSSRSDALAGSAMGERKVTFPSTDTGSLPVSRTSLTVWLVLRSTAVLASTLLTGCTLWTFDKPLHRAAAALNVLT